MTRANVKVLDLVSWEDYNNFSTVDLVKEKFNCEEAAVDEQGDIWIATGANGQWLDEEDIDNFLTWVKEAL